MLLSPGFELTLRPMRYPDFYERYRAAIRNTWTVEEVDLSTDLVDLHTKLSPAERHLINRLVAFFATGDNIVANNVVLSLYRHVNSPEARMFLSRQLYEEAVHIQFYLTLLDAYLPDEAARAEAFAAVEAIPSIRRKAEFCFRWMDAIGDLDELATRKDRQQFLLNLVCFAACVEGLFFFGAFAYVYFLRSKGLLQGLATGTNWVFRDESGHIDFEFAIIDTARAEEPDIFDEELVARIPRDGRRGRRVRGGLRRGRARRRGRGDVPRRDARVPRVHRQSPPRPTRADSPLRRPKPVRLHGVPGRAGAGELLRAAGLRLTRRQ